LGHSLKNTSEKHDNLPPFQGFLFFFSYPGVCKKRCPVNTSFGGRGITPKYAERNTLDLRAGALKTPRVSPLASIDIEIAWENPLSSRHLGRGIFCGLSHAISISMAQREALGRSWRFQSPGQRISASRKMRDPIYQLRY